MFGRRIYRHIRLFFLVAISLLSLSLTIFSAQAAYSPSVLVLNADCSKVTVRLTGNFSEVYAAGGFLGMIVFDGDDAFTRIGGLGNFVIPNGSTDLTIPFLLSPTKNPLFVGFYSFPVNPQFPLPPDLQIPINTYFNVNLPCVPVPPPPPNCKSPTGLDICKLQPGDILLEHGKGRDSTIIEIFGSYWTHAGIYDKSPDGKGYVLEARGVDPNVADQVRSSPIEQTNFYEGANDWIVLRLRDSSTQKRTIDKALEWARGKADGVNAVYTQDFPTGFFRGDNKTQDYGFYCSLFVWRAFKEGDSTLDLDYSGIYNNIGGGLALQLANQVLPDDIFASAVGTIGHPPTTLVVQGDLSRLRYLWVLLSPANLSVSDAAGNLTGIDLQSGNQVNNIPNAYYSGPLSEPEWISAPDILGSSRVDIKGTGSGQYTIGIQKSDGESVQTQTFQWQTQPNQVDTYTVSDVGNGQVTLQPIELTSLIDVRPYSPFNRINLNSRGTIPVVIFGKSNFDVNSINPSTLTLAGASIAQRRGRPRVEYRDVNHDRIQDMVVRFSIPDLKLKAGDTQAVLEGKTYDGVSIRGVDNVQIVPPYPPELESPKDGAKVKENRVPLKWDDDHEDDDDDYAVCYAVEVAKDANFKTLVDSSIVVNYSSYVTAPLANGKYYWHVGISDCSSKVISPWSKSRSFTISPR